MNPEIALGILGILYLLGSISFIIGLKMLSSPDTARQGNLLAAVGMGLAILGTMFLHVNANPDGTYGKFIWENGLVLGLVVLAMAIGTGIGWTVSMKVEMTKMPELVSFFNGMGGACAAVISLIEFSGHDDGAAGIELGNLIVIYLGLMIGSISFSGSMVAFGKLAGKINDLKTNALTIINNVVLAGILALVVLSIGWPDVLGHNAIWIVLGVSLVYGVMFVMPIGGADMPVVISLLNSFTGVAAAFGGFLYDNYVMLTGGILVGSAGTILTILMCEAMNRPLWNVLIGNFGGGSAAAGAGDDGKVAKTITATDAAILCAYANRVAIVPGYGLAVAQAQHVCAEFEKQLSEKGVIVDFPVHPVAGRMPGHMNVLLAEADVPYPKLIEMEDANPNMPSTDVVIVVGANDVVNPAAEDDPSSPIYGMPIIQVAKAKNVIVLKRSMSKGYAGIQNQLFFADNTRMLFGDAKDSLEKLLSEVKDL